MSILAENLMETLSAFFLCSSASVYLCLQNLNFCVFFSPFHILYRQVAEEIRRSVFEETGLTCSAGVAPNRLLAKVRYNCFLLIVIKLDENNICIRIMFNACSVIHVIISSNLKLLSVCPTIMLWEYSIRSH